jgi:phage shock protein A
MSLLNRMTHLLKADAHGVVDSLEDRRLVLRQALREAEGELDRKKARRAALAEEGKRLGEEHESLAKACEKLDADVELALDGEEKDLARFSARKLLELRSDAERCETRLAQVGKDSQELDDTVARQEAELASLKNRVRSALAQAERSEDPSTGAGIADAEVELELLRRRRERQGGE